jgi:signal transduction histidine kinase
MRRHIVALVVAMTTLVVLAFAIPLAVLIRHNVYADAVDDLKREAGDIAIYLRSPTTPTAAEISAYLEKFPDDHAVSVELPDGTVIGTLPPGDVDAARPTPGGPGQAPAGPLVETQPWHDGQLVQQPVPTRQGFYLVRVYATDATLHSGETPWWILLGAASVGLLLIGVGAAELLTRRIVRPLVQTADTAQQLASGDVTARAPTDGPAEVAAVGVALNRLADRIDQLIADERETVADLSHRLRTPLTALRLDAETLGDPVEAERVGVHVSNLERMLTAIIHAARRPQREGRLPSCDATAVVAERVEFWSALTEEQGRRGEIDLPHAPLPVRAAPEDLAAAVDALLENVVAHTPEGAGFGVTLVPADPTGAMLTVSDDGPGLPSDASVRGRSDRGRTGLGLDIVRRCAEASGGTLELGASPSGGALVRLRLGAP